jgi:penicillin-binding protein 2
MGNYRLVILRVLTVSMFFTLLGRLFVMQVVNGAEYQQQASNNQVREVVVPSPRGLILDQVGRVLTGNRSSLVVSVDRMVVLRQADSGVATLRKLGRIVRMSLSTLQKRLTLCGTEGAAPSPICWNGSPFQPIPVARGVSMSVALQVMERRSELKGVQAELQSEREFPQPFNANLAQVLGYLGPVSDQELADAMAGGRSLKRTDLVGRSGLEKVYDAQLRGTPGVTQYAIDRNSTIIGTVDKTEPMAGSYLVTSIDARLQGVVEAQLAAAVERAHTQGFPADSGAAVVLDVRTGRVLAIASYPTYDPSIWIGGISTKDYKALTAADSGNPLFFRPTQALFPPASTFKAITTIAAGNAGYSLAKDIPCPSSIEIGTRTLRNHESHAYGTISIARAMEVSCNTVFYKVGYDLWLQDGGNNAKRPKDVVEKTATAFGLGSPTGIDLPSESSGRVGGRAFKASQYAKFREIWCRRAQIGYPEVAKTDAVRAAYLTELAKENCVDGGKFRGGDAANNAIGQGDTAVTPVQMAVAYAAIANGGTVWEPMIAKALISADGKTIKTFKPKVKGHVKMKKSVRDYLLKSLVGVPLNGTGMSPFSGFPLDKISVAAKTGSGEVTNAAAPVSWFNAFAPAEKPRYEVVMMVSQGGTGALTSGPSVRMIMEALFGVDGSNVDPRKSVLLNGAPAVKLPTVRSDGTVVPLEGIAKTWSPLAAKGAAK